VKNIQYIIENDQSHKVIDVCMVGKFILEGKTFQAPIVDVENAASVEDVDELIILENDQTIPAHIFQGDISDLELWVAETRELKLTHRIYRKSLSDEHVEIFCIVDIQTGEGSIHFGDEELFDRVAELTNCRYIVIEKMSHQIQCIEVLLPEEDDETEYIDSTTEYGDTRPDVSVDELIGDITS